MSAIPVILKFRFFCIPASAFVLLCSCSPCENDNNDTPKALSAVKLGDVPDEPKGLMNAEGMCIALANTTRGVVQLHGGQLEYRGHVVNVARDVVTFGRHPTLPRRKEKKLPAQFFVRTT